MNQIRHLWSITKLEIGDNKIFLMIQKILTMRASSYLTSLIKLKRKFKGRILHHFNLIKRDLLVCIKKQSYSSTSLISLKDMNKRMETMRKISSRNLHRYQMNLFKQISSHLKYLIQVFNHLENQLTIQLLAKNNHHLKRS